MKKLKVVTVVGTRPEIIKLSRVLPLMDEHFDHVIAHTGQNFDFELNDIFFNDLKIRKPDYFFEAAGKTATETISAILCSMEKLLLVVVSIHLHFYASTENDEMMKIIV